MTVMLRVVMSNPGKLLKIHFHEKRTKIKDILLIEFFQILVPKFGSDVFFGSYRAQTKFFVQNSYFLFQIQNVQKISRSITYCPNLKSGPYVHPQGQVFSENIVKVMRAPI